MRFYAFQSKVFNMYVRFTYFPSLSKEKPLLTQISFPSSLILMDSYFMYVYFYFGNVGYGQYSNNLLLSSPWKRNLCKSFLGGIRKHKTFWQCAILVTQWCIQLDRNARVFSNKHLPPHLLYDGITLLTSLWVCSNLFFRRVSLMDLQRDWKLCGLHKYIT